MSSPGGGLRKGVGLRAFGGLGASGFGVWVCRSWRVWEGVAGSTGACQEPPRSLP